MKRDNNRISLTLKEADEVREHLETLYAMEGTLDEDFNRECYRAGFFARKICELIHGHRHPQWEAPEAISNIFAPGKHLSGLWRKITLSWYIHIKMMNTSKIF